MLGTEMIAEVLVVFNEVTRLLAQEDIINVSGSKSSASYN
jgi:hypothetical protein